MNTLGGFLSIARMKNLTGYQAEAEQRAIELFKASADDLVKQYREKYKTQIGTDLAREIFPDYAAASVESKLILAPAIQRSAAALADLVFDQIIAESTGGIVCFTAGGTGAGKTTAILTNIETNETFNNASAIFDGNFNSEKSSLLRIESALQAGCRGKGPTS